jgi:hypothetical protein
MISLPDCSGFAPFRATPDVRKNTFGSMKSTLRREPNGKKEVPMPAKNALKTPFSCIFVALLSNH